MYRTISENTIYHLDQWLQDNYKGDYNLDAWINEADWQLNQSIELGESVAVLELKAYQNVTGSSLTFTFTE